MKKSIQKRILRLTALVLTLLMLALPLFSVFADGTTIPERVSGISDNKVYMLKNKASGLYLTLPDYTEATDIGNPQNNVYQYSKRVNDQYSRAVTITYSQENGLYNIEGLIYKPFGGGRVTIGSNNPNYATNVILSTTPSDVNGEWEFEYIHQYGGYLIVHTNNKALTAVEYSEGNSSQNSATQAGNIVVDGMTQFVDIHQIWLLEEVTVNPHLIKATETIEKKNIGRGNEWLFQLRSSEIATKRITSVTTDALKLEKLVDIKYNDSSIIVKIKNTLEYTNEFDDDSRFAVIKVVLENVNTLEKETRYFIVQDSGSGVSYGCRTIPIHSTPRYGRTTIFQNGTKDILITLASELGGIQISEWGIDNASIADFAEYDGKQLVGTNYALITVSDIGFFTVTATFNNNNETKNYKVVIDSSRYTETGIEYSPNIIDISEEAEKQQLQYTNNVADEQIGFKLQKFQRYLMKTDDFINRYPVDENDEPIENDAYYWQIDDPNTMSVVDCGDNYVIIETDESAYDEQKVVTANRQVFNDVTVELTTGEISVKFVFDTQKVLYLPDGNYFIQNVKYDDKFLEIDNEWLDVDGDSNGAFIELWDYDGGKDQQWHLEYLNNGYYYITSVETGYYLTIADDVLYDEDARIRQFEFDENLDTDDVINPSTYKYQWKIIYTCDNRNDNESNSGGYNGGFLIKNKATIYEDRSAGYVMANGPALIEGSNGNNVLNRERQGDRSDEWHFHKVELLGEYYDNTLLDDYLYDLDEPVPTIGIWKNTPTVSLTLVSEYEGMDSLTYQDYYMALEAAIDEWNDALGITI